MSGIGKSFKKHKVLWIGGGALLAYLTGHLGFLGIKPKA